MSESIQEECQDQDNMLLECGEEKPVGNTAVKPIGPAKRLQPENGHVPVERSLFVAVLTALEGITEDLSALLLGN